jgi:hypothetical protein
MDCQDYREQIPLLLNDAIEPLLRKDLESHLSTCNSCRLEFETSRKIWQLMGEFSEPVASENMRAGFNALLNNFKNELNGKKHPFTDWLNRLKEYWMFQARPRLAFSALLILVGLSTGYFVHKPEKSTIASNRQIDSLSSQVTEMKQLMMLSLLQNPSASQRILAVGYTEEIPNVNNKVIDALLTTLNEDPNVNVRLMTLEALVKYSEAPRVREGLVQSISLQESPLLQSAIADVMVKLQEKKSVESFQKLLHKKNLNQMVKLKIEQSIHKLI